MTTRTAIVLGTLFSLGLLLEGPNLLGQTKSQPSQTSHQMPMNAQDMSKMHQQMMDDMKAEQAKLDSLVKNMNSANGDAKVKAIADVVTELVRDHGKMIDHMGMMHEHMMSMGRGSAGK